MSTTATALKAALDAKGITKAKIGLLQGNTAQLANLLNDRAAGRPQEDLDMYDTEQFEPAGEFEETKYNMNYNQKWFPEHPTTIAKPNAQSGVFVGDIHASMLQLPALLQRIGTIIDGIPDRDYAMSVIAPFHSASKGVRIPSIQPTSTVTGTNFQDLGTFSVLPGKIALWFTSFTCFNTPPWVVMQGIEPQTLDQSPVEAVVNFPLNAPGVVNGMAEYITRIVTLPYNSTQSLRALVSFGVSPNVKGMFSQVRVASAGYRFFKTSASTTESGIIKAYYSDRGSYIAKNLA